MCHVCDSGRVPWPIILAIFINLSIGCQDKQVIQPSLHFIITPHYLSSTALCQSRYVSSNCSVMLWFLHHPNGHVDAPHIHMDENPLNVGSIVTDFHGNLRAETCQ